MLVSPDGQAAPHQCMMSQSLALSGQKDIYHLKHIFKHACCFNADLQIKYLTKSYKPYIYLCIISFNTSNIQLRFIFISALQ